jgi:competence protein ComEC
MRFGAWLEAEQGRFVLVLPVAFGIGILAYFALPAEPAPCCGWLAVGLAGAGLLVTWRWPYGRFGLAILLFASLGFARAGLRTAEAPPLMSVPQGAVELAGTVARIEPLADGRRILLAAPRVGDGPVLARDIRLRLRADDTRALQAGVGIQTYALLFPPGRPAYPGAFDPGRQDFFSGVGADGLALEPVQVVGAAGPNVLAADLQNLRAGIAHRVMAVLPVDTGSVAVTLLTGDEQAIPPPERQNFIAAGLAHILAVAGLHVGIVMGLAFFTTRFLLTRRERWALLLPAKAIAAGAALAAGVGYAVLTGAHLPILRSLAMASLATIGIIAGRRALSLRGLALAALVILLMTPEAIVGVSFQMSFSAVLALIAGFAALRGPLARLHAAPTLMGRIGGHVVALALTSLLAGGASMPFAAYQFQQVQPYWIPANLLAVPLTAFWIMPLGLIALALMPLHLAAMALMPMGWGIGAIVWATRVIAAWPGALLRIRPMPDAAILLMAAGLIWLCIWRSRVRRAGLALVLAGLLVALLARPPDALVGADARLIAIDDGPRVWVIAKISPSAYTLAPLESLWAGDALVRAACSAAVCDIGRIRLAAAHQADCGTAALMIDTAVLRGACPQTPTIDRVFVYQNGATLAWINGGHARLLTNRAAQGARPWVAAYPPAP